MRPGAILLFLLASVDIIQDDGTPMGVRRNTLNLGAGITCSDDVANNRTNCAAAATTDLSGEDFVTFSSEANLSNERVLTSGTNTTVDTGTVGQVKVNLSGTHADSFHSDSYSGVGACAAGSAATTLNDNAAPTCTTQAAFTNEASDFTSDQNFSSKVGIGSSTAPVSTMTVSSGLSSSNLPSNWGTHWSTFGGTGSTSGALALAFDSTNNRCMSACEAPGVALRDWRFHAANYAFTDGAATPAIVANITNAGYISSTTPHTLFSIYPNALLTAITMGGHRNTAAFTATGLSVYVSVASSNTAANTVWTASDGTNTCTFTFTCNGSGIASYQGTGVKYVAGVNGAGTGCVWAANASITLAVTTQGCATAATVKNADLIGKWQ